MPMTKEYSTCIVQRRILEQHGTYAPAIDELSLKYQKWVTRACGKPLFEEDELAVGVCRSCASGWTRPHNYPVDSHPPQNPYANVITLLPQQHRVEPAS